MADNTDMAKVFGPGAGPSLRAAADEAYSEEPAEAEGVGEELPAEFRVHAEEALDPERTPEERMAALYRAIQSCH